MFNFFKKIFFSPSLYFSIIEEKLLNSNLVCFENSFSYWVQSDKIQIYWLDHPELRCIPCDISFYDNEIKNFVSIKDLLSKREIKKLLQIAGKIYDEKILRYNQEEKNKKIVSFFDNLGWNLKR